jgi:beta-lactamase superfamily II metal-dependent hydrolase
MAYIPLETTEEVNNNPDGRLHITFINVGKGDFIAIKTPLGRSIIVDAGSIGRQDFGIRDLAYNVFGYNERKMVESDLIPGDEQEEGEWYPTINLYSGGRRTDDGEFLIVDYDQNSNHIISRNYNHLDYLFITHADQDHYNYIGQVVNYNSNNQFGQDITIGDVFISDDWVNYGADHKKGWDSIHNALSPVLKKKQGNPNIYSNLHTLRVNADKKVNEDWELLLHETVSPAYNRPEPREVQYFRLYCLAAGVKAPSNLKADSGQSRNCKSIVLLLEYGKDRILLTGDANIYTEDAIKRALKVQGASPLTLMQIPHHGAANYRLSQEFIKSLAPRQAIISGPDALRDTKHNHPRFPAVYEADMAMIEGMQLDDDIVMRDENFVSCNIHDTKDGFKYYPDKPKNLDEVVFYPPRPLGHFGPYEPREQGVPPIENIEVKDYSGNYFTVNYYSQASILVTGSLQQDHHVEYNGD